LRYLGLILRGLRLEGSTYNVYDFTLQTSYQFQTTFAQVGRGDCE
jgi:hypothetical protein